MSKIKVVFVVGPTASGKTGLGANIAKFKNGEVVSADSMQIYKGMTIASAAPVSFEDTLGIPHHMVEFLEYGDSFTVADYAKKAREIIAEIYSCGKLPVVVGGTGLYIDTLADNIEFLEQKTDLRLREEITNEFNSIGAEAMLKKLNEFDPISAQKLHPNNSRRIIRAFEVFRLTGKTITEQNELSKQNENPFEPIFIGLNYRDRSKLYDRIGKRIDIMVQNGLLDEAKKAYKLDLSSGAAQAIGHKELFPFFDQDISLEDAIENLKQATRRYAKRQLTWFNRNERINWIYCDETDDVFKEALSILEGVV